MGSQINKRGRVIGTIIPFPAAGSLFCSFPLFPISPSGEKKTVRLSSLLLSYWMSEPANVALTAVPVTFYQVPKRTVLRTLFGSYLQANGHYFNTAGGSVDASAYEAICQAFDPRDDFNNEFKYNHAGASPTPQWPQQLVNMKPFLNIPMVGIGYGNGRHVNLDHVMFDWDGQSDAVMIDCGSCLNIGQSYTFPTYTFSAYLTFSCVVDYV